MQWHWASTLILLLNTVFAAPQGKVTKKPEIPPILNPMQPKSQKPPTHISDFTDPDTGLNPFLDLEEGQTSNGRNMMEDEIRDDNTPYFDMDLVEGDASDRRWGMEEPKETIDKPHLRWPAADNKDDSDFSVTSTPFTVTNPPTTVKIFVTKRPPEVHLVESNVNKDSKVIKGGKESFVVSGSTVIYASATIAAAATIILLIGACWWRRKLKRSQSTTRMENGAIKS